MPTAAQLRKGAVHANYEIGMLMDTAHTLENTAELTDSLVRRALLESWAIHLRALIEFFHPGPKSDPDTVRAEWYVADPATWRQSLPTLSSRERARKKALHKHLAHISFLRDARKTNWNWRDHRIAMRRLELFASHLAPRYRRTFSRLVQLRATA
jgi:hypothetical protein